MKRSSIRQRLVGILRNAMEPVFRLLCGRKLRRDPSFEYAACLIFRPHRLTLPKVELEDLFVDPIPPVTINALPRGSWSSPVVDMVAMARIVAAISPLRILELGSFRGYTAAAMAFHLPSGGLLVTVDIDPKHGVVYRDTPLSGRIDRRVGTIVEQTAGEQDGSFDLIFIDADHRLEAVRSDTEAVTRLLKPDGWLLWHDYSNWGFFSSACGVPEYLTSLARQLPVVHLAGTNIALHRPYWATQEGHLKLNHALALMRKRVGPNQWETEVARP